MKGGKRLITGTSNGEILDWSMSQNFGSNLSQHSAHPKSLTIHAITLSNLEQYIVSGDKEGIIVYSDHKLSQKLFF